MGFLDFLQSPIRLFEEAEVPLIPFRSSNILDAVEAFSHPHLTFQLTSDSSLGVVLRPTSNFYRNLRWFEGRNPRDYSNLTSSVSQCRILSEYFDFENGVVRNAPPTVPRQNCFSGTLPDQIGWFDSRLSMPGSSRTALTYRPSEEVCALRPLVILFHGTGGGSESMSHDLFNENEVNKVFKDRALVFILEARDFMPEDWEHDGFSYTHFWNTTEDRGDSNRDILFVDALIRAAIRDYGADPRQVFFMGHSNGGFAATHFGIALRHLVRGIAVSSAGWVEHSPKRRMMFETTDCRNILQEGLEYFSRIDSRFPSPRPLSVFPEDSRPAFFIRGNSQDREVSAYYTCALDQQLREHAYTEVRTQMIDWPNPDDLNEGYHFVDRAFLRDSWEYLSHLVLR